MKKRYPVKPPVEIGEVYTRECRHCRGNGQEPDIRDLTCHQCMGRGRQKWRIIECKACKGKGRSPKTFGLTQCKNCKGQGWEGRDIG